MALTDDDIIHLSRTHRVAPEATKAVIYVETPAPHLGDYRPGKPLILFERHKFYKYSGNSPVSRVAPELSNPVAGGYSKGRTWEERQAGEHAKLQKAFTIFDGTLIDAALMSISMGMFQIMGFNHKIIGQPTVGAMWERYKQQNDLLDLEDFFRFAVNARLIDKLRSLDWAGFARGYNGAAYARNAYDVKLRDFHRRFVREGMHLVPTKITHGTGTGFPDFSQGS